MANFRKLKVGDVLSETQFYVVAKIKDDKVQLTTDSGEPVVLNEGYVNSLLNSADQFEKEEKVTRTELADILLNNPRVALTVNYNKQVKDVDVLKEIVDVHQNTAPKDVEKQFKAAIKKALNGEERTMIGRHYSSKDDFGRVHFIDMNAEHDRSKSYDTRQRLVDPRTLNWVVVNGTKYVAK